MTIQERFAQDQGVDIDRVPVIVRIAKECGKLNEYSSNGDPHPHNPNPNDKDANSRLWEHACRAATHELLRYVERFGFTAVVYNGLFPALKRGDKLVEIPY